jgi:rhamnose utilization protein RhaD (predicted bifunctional aldolase and dehydrogenase)
MKEIDSIYDTMFEVIKNKVVKNPDLDRKLIDPPIQKKVEQTIEEALGKNLSVLGFYNSDILRFAESYETFAPLALSFTPDHIVYYGFKPVYSEDLMSLGNELRNYVKTNDVNPRLAVVKGIGAFAINTSDTLTEKSALLFEDDVKIAVYTDSFGGYQFMPHDKIDFIRNWEVEKYRVSKI